MSRSGIKELLIALPLAQEDSEEDIPFSSFSSESCPSPPVSLLPPSPFPPPLARQQPELLLAWPPVAAWLIYFGTTLVQVTVGGRDRTVAVTEQQQELSIAAATPHSTSGGSR